MTLMIGSY